MSDLLVRVHVEFQLIERRIRIRTLRTEVAAVAGHLKRWTVYQWNRCIWGQRRCYAINDSPKIRGMKPWTKRPVPADGSVGTIQGVGGSRNFVRRCMLLQMNQHHTHMLLAAAGHLSITHTNQQLLDAFCCCYRKEGPRRLTNGTLGTGIRQRRFRYSALAARREAGYLPSSPSRNSLCS